MPKPSTGINKLTDDSPHLEYALNAVNQGVTALGIKGEIMKTKNPQLSLSHSTTTLYFSPTWLTWALP